MTNAANEMTDQADPELTTEDRLDGWKRIAGYLSRDVRTVRRWEKREGLPVRRLMHDQRATVFAHTSELDAWLRQRAEQVATGRRSSGGSVLGRRVWKRAWLMAPLIVAAFVIWLWPAGKRSAIELGEWDWVLITDFDNRTGEEILDGTVEYGLQRALANSRRVKVVPPERAADSLRLMQLPLDTPINIAIGREISLRDGDIRMLVGGRVEKIGGRYQITADLIDPPEGVTLASYSEEALNQDEILPAIEDMAESVRSALGEGLDSIARSREMLEKATTPSLQALRLYSQANEAMTGPDRGHANAMLEEAVRIDPDFASAHLLLWYTLSERDETERAVSHLERAVALADHASERERLFILATYYSYLDDRDKAIETYKLLLRLYPDHFWAAGNLSGFHEMLGQFRESMELKQRWSSVRPNQIGLFPDWQIVHLAITVHDTEVRDRFKKRLESVAGQPGFEWLPADLEMLPVYETWVNGRYEAALERMERVVASYGEQALVETYDGALFAQVRSTCLALGKLNRFRELSALRPQVGWFQALVDYDSGHPETLKRYLEGTEFDHWDAVLLAFGGDPGRAMDVLSSPNLRPSPWVGTWVKAWNDLVRAQAALMEGRLQDAVSSASDSRYVLNVTAKWAYLWAMNVLAHAHDGLGDLNKAIETLELAALQKPLSIYYPAGTYFWERNQLYLHDLYVRTGQEAAAQATAKDLRQTLRIADTDHPFLLHLNGESRPGVRRNTP